MLRERLRKDVSAGAIHTRDEVEDLAVVGGREYGGGAFLKFQRLR